MRSASIDDVLLAVGDVGLGTDDGAAIAVLGARLRAELARECHRRGEPQASRPRLATRFAAVAAIAVALAGGVVYAVPVTRAGVDDVYSQFSSWFEGHPGAAPGRPISSADDPPSWVTAEDGEKRVLAEADGEHLYVVRNGDQITMALRGFGESGPVDDWLKRIADKKIAAVYPGHFVDDGRHDRRALFGIVARSIERVELTYADGGTPLSQDELDGGFGLVVASDRRLDTLTGYDGAGAVVARVDLSGYDMRYCPWHGCQPWR